MLPLVFIMRKSGLTKVDEFDPNTSTFISIDWFLLIIETRIIWGFICKLKIGRVKLRIVGNFRVDWTEFQTFENKKLKSCILINIGEENRG